MKTLTINQIILLLDISRGTSTQKKISTTPKDIQILVLKGLIFEIGDELGTTKTGNDIIKEIKEVANNGILPKLIMN